MQDANVTSNRRPLLFHGFDLSSYWAEFHKKVLKIVKTTGRAMCFLFSQVSVISNMKDYKSIVTIIIDI